MKINRIITLLLVAIQFAVMDAHPLKQCLHEGWTFRQVRGTNWYPATVPGVVHTDLLDNGLIGDPFYRLNERGVQWVDKEDWMYRTTFDVSPELFSKENIILRFDGLDTYADVTLNGKKILSADNMFREWQADVKYLLKLKDNQLEVYLHSPIKIAMPKWEAVPFQYRSSNDQSENGGLFDRKVGVFVRKAGYHFGWDWGPRLVTSGIWRPVTLEAWNDARINDVFYNQKTVTQREATIDVVVELLADKEVTAELKVVNRTDRRTENRKSVHLTKGLNKVPVSFTMKKPKLWWTNGLGEPFLYDMAVTLDLNGAEVDVKEQKLGIRSLKVITAPDQYGESFYFELNGKPLFAKGSNYIPCDNFLTRVTDSIYDKTIRDAVAANMNMLRVWGGEFMRTTSFTNYVISRVFLSGRILCLLAACFRQKAICWRIFAGKRLITYAACAIMHVLLCGVEIMNAWMPGSTGTGSRLMTGRIRPIRNLYGNSLKISIL